MPPPQVDEDQIPFLLEFTDTAESWGCTLLVA
jgi:hypothetical protein